MSDAGDSMHGSCKHDAVCKCGTACRYVKFDMFHPAVDRGLPITRVINRVCLQEILADAVVK